MMSSKKDQTKTKILEATWYLLESGDYQDVHMTHIAKKAGVSRQAVYLHYKTRADLLIATTRYIDTVKNIDLLLDPSRQATSGIERLELFISMWADYIPEIYGVAKALSAMKDTDDAAKEAWDDRMRALRQGCAAAVKALKKDGKLSDDYTLPTATDLLWTLMSIHNWEQLTQECGWSHKQYKNNLTETALKILQ